jgi:hypothetical protein
MAKPRAEIRRIKRVLSRLEAVRRWTEYAQNGSCPRCQSSRTEAMTVQSIVQNSREPRLDVFCCLACRHVWTVARKSAVN